MKIYEKIKAVMSEVEYLSKDDSVEYKTTKYKAISEEKVTSTVRKSLIKNGLVILPVKQSHTREGIITAVDVTYRIVNTDNPEEFIEVVSSGTGADTQDKGVGKAMTYAYKYMLLRTFAIPTGEDPDKVSSAEITENVEKAITAKRNAVISMAKKKNVDISTILERYKVIALEDMTEDALESAMRLLEKSSGRKA